MGILSMSTVPSYHRIGQDSSEDLEKAHASSRPLMRGPCCAARFARWSLKTLFAVLGTAMVLMMLVFVASHADMNLSATQSSPNTESKEHPPTISHLASSPSQSSGESVSLGDSDVVNSGENSDTNTTPPPSQSDRRLRIIAPADEPGVNLCKMIMSAIANGYPAPIIVNWGRDFGKYGEWFGTSHLGKIDGTLELLETLLHSDDTPVEERLGEEDLILIIDAYDVWFQLPPSVLIQRYYAQNEVADYRVAEGWSKEAAGASPPPKQSIIMSTQKRCWPTEADGAHTKCDILPESTLPKNVYGPDTDNPRFFYKTRPRYINSGSIMGPAGDMLRLFQKAKVKVDRGHSQGKFLYSDQAIFGEILGEQEAWRKGARERNGKHLETQQTGASLPIEADEKPPQFDESYEFGLGLDYVQDLFTPTVFEENDGEYMVLSDEARVLESSKRRGINPPRVRGVPEDLGGLAPPIAFSGLPGAGNDTLGWDKVSLYADYWSGVVPAGVHHNAHRDGMKNKRLIEWWSKTWFFSQLRDIIEAQAVKDGGRGYSDHDETAADEINNDSTSTVDEDGSLPQPLATVSSSPDDIVYWAPSSDAQKPMTRIFEKEKLGDKGLGEADWDTLCAKGPDDKWWEVIFQDGKGPVRKRDPDVSGRRV